MDRFWLAEPKRRIRRVHDWQMKGELGNIEGGSLNIIERFYEASRSKTPREQTDRGPKRTYSDSGADPRLGSAHFPF